MGRDLQTIITGLHYGEAPRWHDGRLWLVDFYSHEVLSFAEDGSDRRVEATVPQQPSGIGWLPDGRLLVVSSTRLRPSSHPHKPPLPFTPPEEKTHILTTAPRPPPQCATPKSSVASPRASWSSTPTYRRTRRDTSTTWSSTRGDGPTPATLATT